MPYGYVDPVQRVHEQQALRRLGHPYGGTQQSYVPGPLYPLPRVLSPLAGLDQAIPQIICANGSTIRYRQHTAERAVVGALIGALIGSWLTKRQARKQQRIQELKNSLGIGGIE